ncbi:MAG: hypothetical protein FWF97_00855 [Alphaproteobacteria bacterium]|nr:hypothetical protein [Alphaproteobacteria bacterium]
MKARFAICALLFALCSFGAFASDDGSADFFISDDIVFQGDPVLFDELDFLFEAGKPFNVLNYSSPYSKRGCPFFTNAECRIWTRKPLVREGLQLPSRSIGEERTAALQRAIDSGEEIDMDAEYMRPLVKRYRTLMRASRACCTSGMVNRLRNAGASRGLIYKFMVDDANFYGFNDRCLVTGDAELQAKYRRTMTANAVSDVRDVCLCHRREWFDALLAPFDDFSDAQFIYTFQDGLKREVTVSITDDVRMVQDLLSQCP